MSRMKSAAELKLAGTYRADRHADRCDIPEPMGVPECPAALAGAARDFWEANIPELIRCGIVRRLDTAACVVACNAWAAYSKAAERFAENPQDKNARIAFVNLQANHTQAAAKIGLTPADRTRLPIAKPVEPMSPLAAFARKRA